LKIALLTHQVSPLCKTPIPFDFDSVKADVAHFLIKKIDTCDIFNPSGFKIINTILKLQNIN